MTSTALEAVGANLVFAHGKRQNARGYGANTRFAPTNRAPHVLSAVAGSPSRYVGCYLLLRCGAAVSAHVVTRPVRVVKAEHTGIYRWRAWKEMNIFRKVHRSETPVFN